MLLLKLGQIFDKLAKLGKSTQDTYREDGWFCKPFWKMGSPKVSVPTLMTLFCSLSFIKFSSLLYKARWKNSWIERYEKKFFNLEDELNEY